MRFYIPTHAKQMQICRWTTLAPDKAMHINSMVVKLCCMLPLAGPWWWNSLSLGGIGYCPQVPSLWGSFQKWFYTKFFFQSETSEKLGLAQLVVDKHLLHSSTIKCFQPGYIQSPSGKWSLEIAVNKCAVCRLEHWNKLRNDKPEFAMGIPSRFIIYVSLRESTLKHNGKTLAVWD